MWSGIATLLARSLRQDARQLRTHLFRLAFAIFVYFALVAAQINSLTAGAPGLDFFAASVWLNVVFITLGGLSFFSSAISEEKEEQTLELLLLTGLSPVGILLGKSTARLFQALLLLAVQFPFTLLAITLGGILLNQVLAAYVALAAYTLLLANVALICSVWAARAGSAAGLTFLFVIGYVTMPWLVQQIQAHPALGPFLPAAIGDVLTDSSVFERLATILSTGFNESVFSVQAISNSLGGLLAFGLAWALFGYATRPSAPSGQSRGFQVTRRTALRWATPSRVWSWPMAWKDFHFLGGGFPMVLLKILVLAVLYPVLHYLGQLPQYSMSVETQLGTHLAISVGWLAIETSVFASRVFHDEIQDQTMSSLLILPRSIGYVAYSKVAGCLLATLPVAAFVLLDLLVLPGQMSHQIVGSLSNSILVLGLFCHLVTLVSLFVRWGALPLSILITMFSFGCCPLLLITSSIGDAAGSDLAVTLLVVGVQAVVGCCTAALLQVLIHARLYEIGSR
jgi:ABC-type transport system involved in multi-copper enzyme maturation permease subunit